MRVLAIESSCDETAAAVVRGGRWIEGNAVASQIPLHQQYGGIVPEVASRAHVQAIVPVVKDAMEQAEVDWMDIDLVAATRGPGLAGSLLIGFNAAKAIAFARDLPFLGVNHLEGHIYANWLAAASDAGDEPPEPRFPLLCLVVSGGHSDLVLMRDHGDLVRIGRTRDDAAGEAFDKVARILGLGFPGGPIIQKTAERGDATRFKLARAWLKGTYDFSFSGLKTALAYLCRELGPEGVGERRADLAAGFQAAAVGQLTAKLGRALKGREWRAVALGGGVAANGALREAAAALCERRGVRLKLAPPALCTDNAAMIGSAARFAPRIAYPDYLDYDAFPSA